MEQKRGLYDELAAVVLPLPHRFFTSVIISVEKLVATSVPDSFQMIPLQEGLSVRRSLRPFVRDRTKIDIFQQIK